MADFRPGAFGDRSQKSCRAPAVQNDVRFRPKADIRMSIQASDDRCSPLSGTPFGQAMAVPANIEARDLRRRLDGPAGSWQK
jgi:hypothetical protein